MKAYLDTSALVKLIVAEEGSGLVVDAVDRSVQVSASRITYPEARAALAAAGRDGRIDAEGSLQARMALDSIWQQVAVVELTASLAASAADLADALPLRGFDAVHLASALAIGSDEGVMITFDRRLWEAARMVGLAVVPARSPRA